MGHTQNSAEIAQSPYIPSAPSQEMEAEALGIVEDLQAPSTVQTIQDNLNHGSSTSSLCFGGETQPLKHLQTRRAPTKTWPMSKALLKYKLTQSEYIPGTLKP